MQLSRLFGALTRWGLGLCALVLVLSALFVSLGRGLVPLVAEYRGEVESRAAQALGMPLSIGSLEGRWHAYAPVLLAHDVVIGQGSSQIRLDQVRVVPDLWGSLLARQVRIAHLEIRGLQLDLKEDQEGHWALTGLPAKADDTAPFDPQKTLEQLQAVSRISLLGSQVTLQPWQQAPLTMTYLDATLRTGLSRQRLDVRATLPDGQPLALNLVSHMQADKWKQASADLYVSLPQADWSRWLPASLDKQWHIGALKAGGEFWLGWADGGVKSLTGRLNASHLDGGYVGHTPANIDDLSVSVYLQRHDQGYELLLDSLGMTLGGVHWGDAHVQFKQIVDPATQASTWHVQADRLDLAPLTPLLDALPLPDAALATVNALQVKGALRNVLLDIRPQAQGDQRLSFAANLDNIAFHAYHGAPAAGNVSGSISGDLGHGELRLASDGFSLHLDPIFAKPWHYLKANATLTWRIDDQAFTLTSPYLQVLGEEGKIAGDFLIRLFFDPAAESYMDLRVGLVDGDGRFTEKYLPATGLSPALADWLKTAIKSGAVDEGIFQYQGSLARNAGQGARTLDLFFKVHNTELDFQPGWPALTGISGDVFIEDSGVRIRANQGQMLGTQVSNVSVDIPHLPGNAVPHLNVLGDFQGTLGDGIQILQQAPIGTADIFAGWSGEGALQGKLKLDIPLGKGDTPKVVVDFSTDSAHLKLPSPTLDLNQLKGVFQFDLAKGLSGKGIQAQVFDKPITAEIFAEGTPGQNRTRIVAKGAVALDKLQAWGGVNHPVPASGELPYQLQISLDGDNSQLLVDSNLQGIAVDLPAPFGKAASETRDSQLRMTLQGPQRQYWAAYGNLANLAFSAPGGRPADGNGELLLGEGAAVIPAQKGVRIRGALSEFELAPWQAIVQRYSAGSSADGAKQFVRSIDLKVGKLKAFDSTINNVSVQLDRGDAAWLLTFDSDLGKGKVGFPDAKTAPIQIDLQQLRLPPPDPVTPQTVDVDKPDPLVSVDPRQIPPLDVHIAEVLQGDQQVGAWALKSRPTANGARFSEVSLGLKGLQLNGDGSWEVDPGAVPPGASSLTTSSWFKGRLQGKNVGDVLKAWGFAPTVTSSDFQLDADGRWAGSPAWISVKRYSGSLDAQMSKGQFTEADGGAQALRVFGLLNFNSIGRRLRLDFSDILGKGLSYDKVKGLLVGDKGVYVTREPITLTGPSSNLELNGTLDMVNDQVNAKLLVTLPVTNNLPLAALIVGAPAIGGALFLVDKLLGDRVARFASVQYKVEGPWKEPKISFDKPFEKPQ